MSGRDGPSVRSVVVAEPDHLLLERILALVAQEPDLEVVGIASRRDDAAHLLWELAPAVAVIAVDLLSFCDHPLHGWGPISREVRLVGVGPGEDAYVASRLRAAGFAAYIAEPRIDDELCDALRGDRARRRTSASRSLTT